MATTPLAKPVIAGNPEVGQPLTGTLYGYQWNRFPGGAIPGANLSTYVPTATDIGATLSLTVGSFDNGVLTSYDVSAATAVVTAPSGGVLDFSQASNSGLIAAIVA